MNGEVGVPMARPSQLSSPSAGLCPGGPGLRASLTCLFLCNPQPETEDEKKRFEEGKGRYLQMKAKRQGSVDPRP